MRSEEPPRCTRRLLLSDALALATAACDAGRRPGETAQQTAQTFAHVVAMAHLQEIEAAEVARSRARSALTQAFAERMIEDHRWLLDELRSAAQAAGLRTEPPDDLEASAARQRAVQALREAPAAQFDAAYMAGRRAALEELLTALRRYAQEGESPDLRDHARKSAILIDQHLSNAGRIEEALKDPARQAAPSAD